MIDRFFRADYRDALEIDRPERYDIRNVAAAFDRLADTLAAQLVRDSMISTDMKSPFFSGCVPFFASVQMF